MLIPNFFNHVVNHRDKFRLVIPEKPPVTIRMVNDSLSDTSSINESLPVGKNENKNLEREHVDATITILQQIIERMRGRQNLASTSGREHLKEFIQIGHTQISCDRVAAVGDVDQNGIVDYIVSSPGKNSKRGSARLYLMGKNNTFLYSRELVPGQWGFDSPPLQPGDLFGSVVHALPVVSTTGMYSLIAVGAPGDLRRDNRHEGEYLNERSFVYVLKVSRKGNVLNNIQLPLRDFEKLTGKYVEVIRKLGAQASGNWSKPSEHDYDEEFEEESKFLDAVEGVRTITFKTAKGEVRAVIRVDDVRGKKLLRKIDEYVAKVPVSRLEKTHLRKPATRLLLSYSTEDRECVYSDNECACKLMSPNRGVELCYHLVGKANADGIGLCELQDCNPGYACTCDGNNLCRREKQILPVVEAAGINSEGRTVCRTRQLERPVNIVMDRVNMTSLSTKIKATSNIPFPFAYNDTHCPCSRSQLTGTNKKKCLQYERTITAKAVICKQRECNTSLSYECDWAGTAYCKHYQRTMELYLIDGNKKDEPGYFYCHRQKTNVTVVDVV